MVESSASVDSSVPPVLDGIVASAVELSGNLGPSLPHLVDQLFDDESFFRCDWVVVKVWLEVLVVSFAALLWRARTNKLRDSDPVVWAEASNKLKKMGIFVSRPRTSAMHFDGCC